MDDPVSRGKRLRQALAERIRSAEINGEINLDEITKGKDISIDVNEAVKTYVSEGTTFDEAETVLCSAGFDIAPRPSPASFAYGWTPRWYELEVNAFLGFGTNRRLEGVRCIVALRPEVPYDYSRVHRVLTWCGP